MRYHEGMIKKRNIIIANWKMNPTSLEEARDLFQKIKRKTKKLKRTEVVVAPSFIHIPFLSKLLPSKNLFLGAQNAHEKDSGPFTGEVSALALKQYKTRYVILGHSERREMGESDEIVKEKIQNSLRHGITPIVCIGEEERDIEGAYLNKIRTQLINTFSGLQKKFIMDCIICYEPVWAIGHSYKDSLSGTDMHEMALFIRKTLSEIFGKDFGWGARIIYGGSVEDENARDIIEKGDVVGFLVGHASLEVEEFSRILNIVDEEKKEKKLKIKKRR